MFLMEYLVIGLKGDMIWNSVSWTFITRCNRPDLTHVCIARQKAFDETIVLYLQVFVRSVTLDRATFGVLSNT